MTQPSAINGETVTRWFIVPGREISPEMATRLIGRPDVRGGHDGMWPGHDQTWRIR
jgi:hypothetical protein